MKKTLLILSLIAVFISTVTAFALSVKTIYNATGVAEPVTITLGGVDSARDTTQVQVTRLSRGGAQFGIATTTINSWSTSEWTRDIQIRLPTVLYDAGMSITLTVGRTEYELTSRMMSEGPVNSDTSLLVITKADLGRPPIYMPFFGSILNWPGDATAITRAFTHNLVLALLCGIMSAIALFGYHWLSLRPYTPPDDRVLKKHIRSLTVVGAFVLSLFSLALFVSSGPTAYTWPSLDMGPYFERVENPDFLPNDFYTNSSSAPSPRLIFGTLITSSASLFSADWYKTLFWYRVMLVTFLPPLIFLALVSFFCRRESVIQIKATILIGIGVGLALVPLFSDQFTVALWRPIDLTVTPHALALCIGMAAMYLSNHGYHRSSLPVWFFATLMHPAVGLSLITFYAILTWQWQRLRLIAVMVAGILLPFAALHLLFAADNPLSAADFVYHYVLSNHPIHYLPSQFESSTLSPFPWYVHFFFVNLLLLCLTGAGWWQKQRFVVITGALALASYLGAVALCFLFIELWPIKSVAVLGPSRYTLFGYWFVVMLTSTLLTLAPLRYFLPRILFFITKTLDMRFLPQLTLTILALLVIGVSTHLIDTPQTTWRDRHQGFSAWVENTPDKAVFAANSNAFFEYLINTPLTLQRSVLAGNGFPFREDDFIEYNRRRSLLYGSPEHWETLPGSSFQIKSNVHFRSLTPSDFKRISSLYPLDYVIIEPSFALAFQSYTPTYKDETVYVYSVADFRP
ncbi:hypothetical protein K2Q16_00340 [Patescibacteria group bacterium]|nr:hypothetical protein [Patescibacteria group bacterium]